MWKNGRCGVVLATVMFAVLVARPCSHTRILSEDAILRISTRNAGILKRYVSVGDEVKDGDLLGEIIHPLEGSIVAKIVSPIEGTIFFSHNKQLVMEHTDIFNVIPIIQDFQK